MKMVDNFQYRTEEQSRMKKAMADKRRLQSSESSDSSIADSNEGPVKAPIKEESENSDSFIESDSEFLSDSDETRRESPNKGEDVSEDRFWSQTERRNWEDAHCRPNVWIYTGSSGLKSSVSEKNPLAVFYEVFDQKFWEGLVTGTNEQAEELRKLEKWKRKMGDRWNSTTIDEMKAFYALCLIMADLKKPSIQMYWSKRSITETPIFGKVMPFSRFLNLSRFLHFSAGISGGETDRMRKIRGLEAFFNEKFKEIYSLEEQVFVEEYLVTFRRGQKEVLDQRDRFGIKIYKLCESRTGYCSNFKICPEKGRGDDPDLFLMEFLGPILDKGHTLLLENWSASAELYSKLFQRKTNVVETGQWPKQKDLSLINSQLPESSQELLDLRWRGETEAARSPEGSSCRRKRKLKRLDSIGSGKAVDRDRALACFPVMRKFVKGSWKLFFYITDLALFNAYILYKTLKKDERVQYASFRMDVAESLMKNVILTEYKARGRPLHGDVPLRLNARHWAHFPRHIPPTERKSNPTRACKVCTRHKKRSETTWECKQCLVALHVPDCFERYHTVQDY